MGGQKGAATRADTGAEVLDPRHRTTAGEGGSVVLDAYLRQVAAGEFERDPAQVAVACALDDVLDDLGEAHGKPKGFWRRRRGRTAAVRGLYVWGSVGRGKTMLMDLFHGAAPLKEKRRLHFNEFMQDAHRRIGRFRKTKTDDPVGAAAKEIGAEAKLLCFDEFAVTDIADAMILARLFGTLFKEHVTLVATSNVAPQDLYQDGLNRKLFEPFIALLQDNVDVVRLDADVDYRLNRLQDRQLWFRTGDLGFERTWLASLGERTPQAAKIPVGSRSIAAPCAAGGMARFTFDELCRAPLGAGDQLAIAGRFHTIFLDGVPVMTPSDRETLRRFINLIDVLYDQRVRLVVRAEGEPNALFDPGSGGAREEAFAFDRTASRLFEMRSASYVHALETTPM
ncbi:MAG: cell division protein ZapE [Pseudomonadota bacterium]